jgi:hypothetical protein
LELFPNGLGNGKGVSMSKETMKLALEALEAGEYYIDDLEAIVYASDDLGTHEDRAKMQAAITALREALAEQPAQQGCMRCNTPKKCALYGCSPLTWPSEKPAQQTIHCKHRRENSGVCPHHNLHCGWPKCNEPEQPAQQEPVAWISHNAGLYHFKPDQSLDPLPLYLAPPAQRKPLTDEQIIKCWGQASGTRHGYVAFARAIEAAHGIKENT